MKGALIAWLILVPQMASAQETAPDAGVQEVAPAPSEPAPSVPPPPATTTPATTTTTATPATTTTSAPATTSSSSTARPRPREPEEVQVEIPAYSRTRRNEPEEEEEPKPEDTYDFLWIELSGGLSYVDLRAIDTSNFYPEFVRLSGWGPVGSLALGFRVDFFSVGLRASLARYDSSDPAAADAVFDVGTAVAEVSLAIPIPIVRPFIRAGIGFAWHGDSNFMAPDMSATTVYGWVFNAGIGVDIFIVEWFSIGVVVSADILNMNRQSFDETPSDPGMVEFSDTGDAIGAQGRATAGVTFRF